VGSVTIRQQDGLYSLNDLHKASGGKATHRPNSFLDTEHAKALVTQLEKAGIFTFKTAKSRYGSTYACAELAVAYAAWISATFHMQVIRVFLAGQPLPVSMRTLRFTIPHDQIRNARWLLDVDNQGNPRTRRLSDDTYVLTRARLVCLLIQNPTDLHLSLEERLAILAAILRCLSQFAAITAHTRNLKPAPPPVLTANDIGSLGYAC